MTIGNVVGGRPGMFDMLKRSKWCVSSSLSLSKPGGWKGEGTRERERADVLIPLGFDSVGMPGNLKNIFLKKLL